MDPISHYMISWIIGKKLELEKNVYKAFLIASLIPDIDVVTIVFGFDYLLKNHATASHSIIAGLIFAFIISIAFRDIKKILPFALLGVFLHSFIDILVNTAIIFQGGCTLLWPFSDMKFLLAYHVDIPGIVFRSTYVLVALVMYSSALYYILKKDYPWSIWVGKR
jgi:membrane-bound metal-dependent hydrolase YbcI (DUF457 family)